MEACARFSKRRRLVQVTIVEVGKFPELAFIKHGHTPALQADDTVFPQLPE
jgi:hypothetical protein